MNEYFKREYIAHGVRAGKKDLILRLKNVASTLADINTDNITDLFKEIPRAEELRNTFKEFDFFAE